MHNHNQHRFLLQGQEHYGSVPGVGNARETALLVEEAHAEQSAGASPARCPDRPNRTYKRGTSMLICSLVRLAGNKRTTETSRAASNGHGASTARQASEEQE